MKSSTEVSAISRPRPMTTRCWAVRAISLIRWLETSTVRPSAARECRRVRTQRMPSGSSPLTGSSKRSTPGSPSRAAAMPRRCPMPSEKVPDRLVATVCSPTSSSTSSTRRRGMSFVCGQGLQVVAGAAARVDGLGLQQGAHLAQRPGQLAVAAAVHRDLAVVGGVEAHDHAHGGGLARPVGPEEAGDHARPARRRRGRRRPRCRRSAWSGRVPRSSGHSGAPDPPAAAGRLSSRGGPV